MICPGYVDQSKIIIRNQTQSTINRSNGRSTSPAPPLLEMELFQPRIQRLVERGKYLFAAREFETFPYLRIFRDARPYSVPLFEAVRAVSLAYLSLECHSYDLLQKGRVGYGLALKEINRALHSREGARDNAILLAVILLDLFEQTVEKLENGEGSNHRGSRHLNGALILFDLAGKEQFNDRIRVDMLHYLTMEILLNCMMYEHQVPAKLLLFRQLAEGQDPRWEVENKMIQFIENQHADRRRDSTNENWCNGIEEIRTALAKVEAKHRPRVMGQDVSCMKLKVLMLNVAKKRL
jgi:stalled ribosome alternative rescue factor ArfA